MPQTGNSPDALQGMNGYTLLHACDGILLHNKKSPPVDAGTNLDEAQRRNAEQEKPASKGYALKDLEYSGGLGLEEGENGEFLFDGFRVSVSQDGKS